ncbi:heterokaryon incompatibility protein-domain-containing protein, partial [Bisporella sp. PMI_857]
MDHSAGGNYSAIDIEILNQSLRRAYKIPDSQNSFRPIRGPLVDWDIVREWLKHCEENHVSQDHGPSLLPKGFRLIDVKRRKVIIAPQKCKFAALSYVWGYNPDPTKLLATKSTIQNLSEDGAIQDSKLPPTISDALEICRSLNQEYLWVDRLCIVQDDNEHKMAQIEAMNNIYTSATITIVQASGDDMESSLPGVVMPRSSIQGQIDILGMRITSILPKTTNFSYRSSWSKRGWTYQEAALSKKKLVITDLEVIFDCHAEVNWEDRYG